MVRRDGTKIEATPRQLEELIGRIERNAFDDADPALLARVVRLVLTLTELLRFTRIRYLVADCRVRATQTRLYSFPYNQ